jgi:chromosomal replication initiator protein
LSGTSLTADLVDVALADLLPQRSELEPKRVIDVVAHFFNLSTDKLLSTDRSRSVALPRQIAMYILRQESNFSLPQIGEALGGRDHTTVMYAIEKVSREIKSDTGSKLSRDVMQIRQQLFGQAAAA